MCGRYVLAQEHEALRIRFGFSGEGTSSFSHKPSYNIAPSQSNPVVVQNGDRKLLSMRWGLVPHWAKDSSIGNNLINARSETVAEKPSFRDSFRKRRCLVPASGFFEWKKLSDNSAKQPTFIRVTNQELFSMAGLWSLWKNPDSGDELLSYTILTTAANDFMKPIHHRMPVILRREDENMWLNPSSDGSKLIELLSSLSSSSSLRLESYPVSTYVNSPANNSPDCLLPL